MLDLTWVDYAYVGVLIASTVWATIRGGIYETIATLSWVVAAIAARFVSPMLDKLLQGWFGLSESTVGTLVASYFIVFFVILLIVGFFNQKLRDRIHASIMSVTDHTLGVIFGLIRGVVLMGICYWAALWYFSDSPVVPRWLTDARTRPIMQLTAIKLDEWFIPGAANKLLQRDLEGTREAQKIFDNLINPRVVDAAAKQDAQNTAQKSDEETGYKNSERSSLENQLLQIESVAKAVEQHEKAKEAAAAE
jgi:membrane protein required for colicin V production